jgi:hypothetical protein
MARFCRFAGLTQRKNWYFAASSGPLSEQRRLLYITAFVPFCIRCIKHHGLKTFYFWFFFIGPSWGCALTTLSLLFSRPSLRSSLILSGFKLFRTRQHKRMPRSLQTLPGVTKLHFFLDGSIWHGSGGAFGHDYCLRFSLLAKFLYNVYRYKRAREQANRIRSIGGVFSIMKK